MLLVNGMSSKIELLNYIKENDIIRIYQMSFDELFDINFISNLSNDDVKSIIFNNKYECAVKLYEFINNIKINSDILNYIYSLNDEKIIRYCLRMSISKKILNDKLKLEYVEVISKSNSDVVQYTYSLLNSDLYCNKDDSILFAKIISQMNANALGPLSYLLYDPSYRDDSEIYNFTNLVKDVENDYVIEDMINLFTLDNRPSLSNMSTVMCSKNSNNAYLVSELLKNPILNEREDVIIILMMIAMCEESNSAKEAYNYVLENICDINLYNSVFEIVNNTNIKVKQKTYNY